MAYAVVMHISETDAPRVRAVWDILAQRDNGGSIKFSDDQIRFNYPPHVSPAIIEDSADANSLIEGLKSVAKKLNPIPVAFDGLVVLPRKGDVKPILARPDMTEALMAANREVCGVVSPDKVVPYSRPGAWQPHTTLARDVPNAKVGPAIEAVLGVWEKFTTVLDRMALLHTRLEGKTWHVKELWRANLGGG